MFAVAMAVVIGVITLAEKIVGREILMYIFCPILFIATLDKVVDIMFKTKGVINILLDMAMTTFFCFAWLATMKAIQEIETLGHISTSVPEGAELLKTYAIMILGGVLLALILSWLLEYASKKTGKEICEL
jgi:hypothetical protein